MSRRTLLHPSSDHPIKTLRDVTTQKTSNGMFTTVKTPSVASKTIRCAFPMLYVECVTVGRVLVMWFKNLSSYIRVFAWIGKKTEGARSLRKLPNTLVTDNV